MIKLTYIFHSCFMLETEQCVLIFDYWKDSPDGDVKKCSNTPAKEFTSWQATFTKTILPPK